MTKDIKFSFILPAYKDIFLKKTITSILNQTYPNFELIIIDDCSPYNIKSIVDTFNDDRITYYRNQTNIGGKDLVQQWNNSIELATGNYTILSSDDDTYEIDFLEEINKIIKSNKNVKIIRARVKEIDEYDKVLKIDPVTSSFLSIEEFLLFEKNISTCISNYVFETLFIKESQFVKFPLAWFSDKATIIKLAKDGIYITDKILFSFRQSTIHISHKKDLQTIKCKLNATQMFFNWLKEEIKYLNNSTNYMSSYVYNQFFESNHIYFNYIKHLLFKLNFISFINALLFSKRNNIITKKEFYKLIYFYIANLPVKK